MTRTGTSEFNRAMRALPEPPDGKEPYWNHWRRQLWELGQTEDPAGFMGWPPVYYTMLVSHWSMDWQLSRLQAAVDWPRWEYAIQTPDADYWWRWKMGEQVPDLGKIADFQPDTNYSKNLINQAYHLLQWEQRTGRRVADLESIVEVGGGYGALALVARRLGFRGYYHIYDLPEFVLLQQWFLSQVGIEANWGTGVMRCDLLVGIYSLSEMPLRKRAWILKHAPASSYLLVYSQRWQRWDNLAWFTDWTATLGSPRRGTGQPGYEWRYWPMVDENDRPDWYCIGWKR